MFRCGLCRKQVPAGVATAMVVTQIRQVMYPAIVRLEEGKPKRYTPRGHETAKEVPACPVCAAELTQPEIVGEKIIPGEIVVEDRIK